MLGSKHTGRGEKFLHVPGEGSEAKPDPETGRYKTYAVTLRNDRGIDDYQP